MKTRITLLIFSAFTAAVQASWRPDATPFLDTKENVLNTNTLDEPWRIPENAALTAWSEVIAGPKEKQWIHIQLPGVDPDRMKITDILSAGNDLYVAGSFPMKANGFIERIARWNGRSWSYVQGIRSGAVLCLAMFGDDLVAGGTFQNAGMNHDADNIAYFNGTQWKPMGKGLNNTVRAITIMDGTLIVGGAFTRADEIREGNYIARWDGTKWSAIGKGLMVPVYELKSSVFNLYAAGYTIGALNETNPTEITENGFVAQWNGRAWSTIWKGARGEIISDMIAYGRDVYIGGLLYNEGGFEGTHGVERFDGDEWHIVKPFNTGQSTFVSSFLMYEKQLYACVISGPSTKSSKLVKCDIQQEKAEELTPRFPKLESTQIIVIHRNRLFIALAGSGGLYSLRMTSAPTYHDVAGQEIVPETTEDSKDNSFNDQEEEFPVSFLSVPDKTETIDVQKGAIDPTFLTPRGEGTKESWATVALDPRARIKMLQVYDMTGRLVFREKEVNIDPSGFYGTGIQNRFQLPSGLLVYQAEIIKGNGETLYVSGRFLQTNE